MTRQAGVYVPCLSGRKNQFGTFLFCMTLVAALHVTALAIQLVVRDFGDLHKAALFFIPTAHTFTSEVQAFSEERGQARLIRLYC
jgi:hypothetical protein